jgi:hypothetical protein
MYYRIILCSKKIILPSKFNVKLQKKIWKALASLGLPKKFRGGVVPRFRSGGSTPPVAMYEDAENKRHSSSTFAKGLFKWNWLPIANFFESTGTKKDRYSDGIFQILSCNLILIVVKGFLTSWADSYFVNKNIQISKEFFFFSFSFFENEALFTS